MGMNRAENARLNLKLRHLTHSDDPDNPSSGAAHDDVARNAAEAARLLAQTAEGDAGAAQDDVDDLIVAFHAVTDPADRTKILAGAVPELPQDRIEGLVDALTGKAAAAALEALQDDVLANDADIEAAQEAITGNTTAIASMQAHGFHLPENMSDFAAALTESLIAGEKYFAKHPENGVFLWAAEVRKQANGTFALDALSSPSAALNDGFLSVPAGVRRIFGLKLETVEANKILLAVSDSGQGEKCGR